MPRYATQPDPRLRQEFSGRWQSIMEPALSSEKEPSPKRLEDEDPRDLPADHPQRLAIENALDAEVARLSEASRSTPLKLSAAALATRAGGYREPTTDAGAPIPEAGR